MLCRTGEIGNQVFLVIDGEVAVTTAAGRVATLGRGDVVGELALVTSRRRNADVVCLTDASVRVFTPGEFRTLVDRDADFARSLELLVAARAA